MAKRNGIILAGIWFGSLLLCGCQTAQTAWTGPLLSSSRDWSEGDAALAKAEKNYALGLEQLRVDDAGCVDSFYQAAVCSHPVLHGSIDALPDRVRQLHHSSLSLFIQSAQQFKRLKPNLGIEISTATGPGMVPTRLLGFAWQPSDFQRFVLIGDYKVPRLKRSLRTGGWGVPLVVVRQPQAGDRFYAKEHAFAATLTMTMPPGTTFDRLEPSDVSLTFIDPLTIRELPVTGEQPQTISGDTTAPLAWMAHASPSFAAGGFRSPGAAQNESRLMMLEPYRRHRIPVVLVHGLRSEARTWLDLVNELHGSEWFNQHCQIWLFQYPSGEPFIRSAANLRNELRMAYATLSEDRNGAALSQMVLVGHSMGGLISKLQVVYSENRIWSATANRPIESLNASAETRADLRQLFYFEPLPFVRRVVFVATPHQGSTWANRLIGRIGARLVRPAGDRQAVYDQLIRSNPGTFSSFVARRLPTSVDMLRSENPYLEAMQQMPVSEQVTLHSVIGTGRRMVGAGPADGVVPVSSARDRGAASEVYVDARHSEIHRRLETLYEVLRILKLDAESLPTSTGSDAKHPLRKWRTRIR